MVWKHLLRYRSDKTEEIVITCYKDGDRVWLEGPTPSFIDELTNRGIPTRKDEQTIFVTPNDGNEFWEAFNNRYSRGTYTYLSQEFTDQLQQQL